MHNKTFAYLMESIIDFLIHSNQMVNLDVINPLTKVPHPSGEASTMVQNKLKSDPLLEK